MRKEIAIAAIGFGLFAAPQAMAQEKKPSGPIVLSVVSKKEKYSFDGAGKTPKEYREHLEAIAKKLNAGEAARAPRPLAVDLVLKLRNTSKEPVVAYIGGDPNVHKFELSGGTGVVAMNNPVAFTTEFRLPKPVTIDVGMTYEIPVKVLADGNRGLSRLLFWTGPGEYKLTATYMLSDKDGERAAELKSEPIVIKVEEK